MINVLVSLLQRAFGRMTTMHVEPALPAADSVSRRLRELADQLDTSNGAETMQIAVQLQSIAQQLLDGPTAQNAGPAVTATTAAVEQLERSYAAPAADKEQQAQQQDQTDLQPASKKQRRVPKSFDFSKYSQRYVALHVMYVGWDYHGFARQADTDNTIEGKLFPALRKVKLIPEDCEISTLDYSRCGRTDKGVSALGQVLALKLRSAALAGEPLPAAADELDYPNIINRALPDSIRVLGWADVQPDFNARFSALDREYKYFIVQDGGLDVQAMQQAAQYLVGDHDFRNFCKADVAQVRNFRRVVLSANIDTAGVSCIGNSVIALHIRGTAFLWHQVRCIAAVLLMVGRGQEQPTIVQDLLDISKVPRKPQYSMAAEEPLLFFGCGFEGLHWQRSEGLLAKNLAVVGTQLQQHLVAAALTSSIFEELQQQRQLLLLGHQQQGLGTQQQQEEGLEHLGQQQQSDVQFAAVTNGGSGSIRWLVPKPPHIPLLKRATEPSIEERFEKAGISVDLLNQKGLAAFLDA